MNIVIYDLYEDITDGKGFAYRKVYHTTNWLTAFWKCVKIYFNDTHGIRIEFVSELGTEVLWKKCYYEDYPL